MDMSSNRVIIDVREPNEYQTGHAEGALNIPLTDLMSGTAALDTLDKDAQLVLYCRSGSRSSTAIQIFKQMGFTNLVNGINAEHVAQNYPNG